MSRLKKFTYSLLSGYVMLWANIFYTLASIPLALHYLGNGNPDLGKAEFGLWAFVSQIGGYILLIDLGMSGSVARILIDHKDDRSNGAYGGVIKTGALVGLVQGAIIVAAGTVLSELGGSLLQHLPAEKYMSAELRGEFVWLMIGQSSLLGVTFVMRIFSQLLYAHQRLDVSNHASSMFFFLNVAAMWAGFAGGMGIYSFLIGQAVMTLGVGVVNAMGCIRLGFMPQTGEWGRMTMSRFREVFAFANDFFLYSLGSQLINASQTILLTWLLGLETAAVWTVGTRAYQMLTLLLSRFFDYSVPALAEMIVRGEKERLAGRFKQIVIFSFGLAVAAGGLFALCNSAFVTVWTHGRIDWPPVNDLLLAVWLVACLGVRLHSGLVIHTKKFQFLRYILFVEGTAFIGLTLSIYRYGGITAMLMASILCTLSFSLPYCLNRTRKYFGLGWRELADWHRQALVLALWLAPAGALTWWLTRGLSAPMKLVLGGGVFGLWTVWAWLRFGLTPALQNEIAGRVPPWAKSILTRRF